MLKTTMKMLFFLLSATLVFVHTDACADKSKTANKRGITAFEEQKYDESAAHFTDALIEKPESPELKYNLGTALSEQKESEKALPQLDAAARGFKDNSKKAAAYFNIGNTQILSGNIEEAIDAYKKAVKLDQSSEDIRNNLEIAIRKWNEQKKKEQQQDGENKDSDDKEQKDGDQDQQDQDGEEKENEDQGENQQEQPQDEENKRSQDQQNPQQQNVDESPMTPEEAKQLLDAMENEEKKALELRRMKAQQEMKQGDDW